MCNITSKICNSYIHCIWIQVTCIYLLSSLIMWGTISMFCKTFPKGKWFGGLKKSHKYKLTHIILSAVPVTLFFVVTKPLQVFLLHFEDMFILESWRRFSSKQMAFSSVTRFLSPDTSLTVSSTPSSPSSESSIIWYILSAASFLVVFSSSPSSL